MITLDIPKASPSLNRLHGRHWSHCYRTRKEWQRLVSAAVLEAKAGRPKYSKARVTIERYGASMLDTDNAYGGSKCIVDALRIYQLIEDDSPDHLELKLVQHVGKSRRTVIRIEEMS